MSIVISVKAVTKAFLEAVTKEAFLEAVTKEAQADIVAAKAEAKVAEQRATKQTKLAEHWYDRACHLEAQCEALCCEVKKAEAFSKDATYLMESFRKDATEAKKAQQAANNMLAAASGAAAAKKKTEKLPAASGTAKKKTVKP